MQGSARLVLATFLLFALGDASLFAGIHRAPIIIPAKKMRDIADYPVGSYRLFRLGADGLAVPIPFQIDEVNKIGDYVLNEGPQTNAKTADGVFSELDELSFMGDDVGDIGTPTRWPDNRAPDQLYELRLSPPHGQENLKEGAVYVAVFMQKAPPSPDQKYVIFDMNAGQVATSRYRYRFDKKNYLVVNGVDMQPKEGEGGSGNVPLIDSSTFYAKADLKYFLTVQVNHRSVNSRLEAYKSGPIRTIVRVTFFYTFLKLNFEVGMYTEVSFFSNSVILPAIIYNPLDGIKSLNKGSGFYYGFALRESPKKYQFDTNMMPYQDLVENQKSLLGFLKKEIPVEKDYWASLIGDDRMLYVMLKPSQSMLAEKNVPYYYVSDKDGSELRSRNNNDMKPIVESPVNLGLYFDLTRFKEGEHFMSFQLFFENKKDPKVLDIFKTLDKWRARLTKVSS